MKRIILNLLIITFIGLTIGCLEASDKEDELFFVAQKAFEDGFCDIALSYLERFLDEYPETTQRPQVYLLIGKCYLYQAKYLKALEQFQMLLDMPQSQDIKDAVLFWLGELHFKGKDYKLAEDYYHKLISEFPNSKYLVYAYYSLGWSLFEQGQFQDAINYHEKLIKDFPNHELVDEATLKISESLYSLKRYKESEENLNIYINKFPKSEKIDQAYFYLGELNYYQEEFDKAIENYLKSIEVSKDTKMITLAKTGLGWSHLKLKKHKQAESIFQEALKLAKDNDFGVDFILLGEATLQSELDNSKQALDIYQQIITSLPESEVLLDAYFGKANLLYVLGRESAAIPVYEKILEKSKDYIGKEDLIDKAHFGLAWTYLKLGRLNDAIKELEVAVEKTNNKTTKISALCQIGDAYHHAGQLEKALDIYDKVLKDYPDSFYSDYVQYQEGVILLKLERIDAATIAFQSLKTNFSDSRYIHDSQYYLGLAYFKKGDFISAKTQLEDLIENQRTKSEYQPEAIFLFGMTLSNLEEYRDAIHTYQIIRRRFKGDKELIAKSEYEIANCLYLMGKVPDALKKFKIIVYKFPKSEVTLGALKWLGDYYLKINKFDIARKYFQRIIDDFPEKEISYEAYYQIGESYYEEERFDEALEQFKTVKENSKGKLAGLASLEMANILSQKEDKDLAIKEYKDILIRYPSLAKQAYAKLAQFYNSLGNHDEAIGELLKALEAPEDESDIRDPQIQFNLAEIFEEKGDFDKAIETYFKVTYLFPKDKLSIKSYLRVARIFENRESWDKAKKIYEKILAEELEESKFAQERLDWINENIRY